MRFSFVVEAYSTDSTFANYERENDGWIRLELLRQYSKLSSYNYETILNALTSKPSNLIELSSFQPRCIRRRRCQPFSGDRAQDDGGNVVLVSGLPFDVRKEDLIEFFNRFYPVKNVMNVDSFSRRFPGKIQVIFNKSQDAVAFVQQSKLSPIRYIHSDPPLVCQMFNAPPKSVQRKSFSTRLNNHSGEALETAIFKIDSLFIFSKYQTLLRIDLVCNRTDSLLSKYLRSQIHEKPGA